MSNATLISDSDAEEDIGGKNVDPSKPWMAEFRRYLDTHDIIPEGTSIVRWWGLNASRYPTWASLARDYLPVMASSVSSERAFSSAGITISKRRNRLKRDIVEALQCLKCMYHNDLIFREVVTAEEEVNDMEREPLLDTALDNDNDEVSWDSILILDDNESEA